MIASRAAAARFGISAIVTATLTLGVASVVVQSKPSPPTSRGLGTAQAALAGFMTMANLSKPPSPLGPPPQDQLIQLVSFNKDAPPPTFGERAPWWTPAGIPRVPHITQFDGGPYGSVNSVMAAGAMLARLAYGIPTTGSQLRSLTSNERSGGTTLADLDEALQGGWHVGLGRGTLSPLDFRALMYAGAGAVIIVAYDQVPIDLREQPGFFGAHAIYLDAYRSGSNGRDGEYFAMDPMGGPWGSRGDWWSADVVERAAMVFADGGIAAAWAFAGGIVPHGSYPPLPPADFPEDPGNSPEPASPSLEALPTAHAPSDPTEALPVGDPGPATPPETGDYAASRSLEGVGNIDVFLGVCVTSPPPAFCPPGVPAVYPTPKIAPPTLPPLVGHGPLDLLYSDTPQPGIQRTIFSAPPGVEPTFSYWPADGSAPALTADVEAATLDGKPVWIATFPVQPGTYDFMAYTRQAGVVSTTEVGAIQFGQ